jgi:peptidyl-prolyl cis-trans isomerase SurA
MKALSAILTAGAVIGAAAQVQAQLVTGIEAIVHDSIITREDVEAKTAPAADVLWRTYRNQPEVFAKKVAEVRNENLEELVERQLILRDFQTGYNFKVDEIEKEIQKEIDKDIQDEIREGYNGSRVAMLQTLQARGITLEKHRQQIHDNIIIGFLRQKNISSEIIVSPHKVETYYQAHLDNYKVQDEVKLRMIVLKNPVESETAHVEKLAEDILTKLNEGATFAEMATIHSEGSQRNQGGEMGWAELDGLSMGLRDMANTLQPGQRSGVTSRSAGDDYWVCEYENGKPTIARHYKTDPASKKETLVEERKFDSASSVANLPPPQEFYLMLVEDKRAAHVKPLNDVRDQIEKDLLDQEQKQLKDQWIERLKKKTFVRYF